MAIEILLAPLMGIECLAPLMLVICPFADTAFGDTGVFYMMIYTAQCFNWILLLPLSLKMIFAQAEQWAELSADHYFHFFMVSPLIIQTVIWSATLAFVGATNGQGAVVLLTLEVIELVIGSFLASPIPPWNL